MFFESAHLAHVLFTMDAMNDATGPKKKTGFKESMRYEMEDSGGVRANSASQEHITNLADRGIGQHTFDIELCHADGSRHDRSASANKRNDSHRHGRQVEQHATPDDHIDSRRNHGGRVDQGTDRCWAFHSIREPGIKRNLRRLPCCANKQQHSDDGYDFSAIDQFFRGGMHNVREVDGAKNIKYIHDRQQEGEIPNTVDDKSFGAGIARRLLFEIIANEKIGTAPDTFPTNEHEQEVIAHNEQEHGGSEQVEIGEEPVVAELFLHVTNSIDMDDRTDTGNDKHHNQSERVNLKTEVHDKITGPEPGPGNLLIHVLPFWQHEVTNVDQNGGKKRQDHTATGDKPHCFFANFQTKKPVDDGSDQRIKRDQAGQFQQHTVFTILTG